MTTATLFDDAAKPGPNVAPGLRCSACGRRLKPDHCVIGRDRRLTDGRRLPRYCWPGEGCHK